MVHIVTGKINSGKTGKLAAICQFERRGDGFVSVKEMADGVAVRYNAMRLSTMEERPFLCREGHFSEGFDPVQEIGPYRMSGKGLEWIEAEVGKMLESGVEPIYLDEIGPLELSGGGLAPILSRCLGRGTELYLSVRRDFVEAVLARFGIEDYDLM